MKDMTVQLNQMAARADYIPTKLNTGDQILVFAWEFWYRAKVVENNKNPSSNIKVDLVDFDEILEVSRDKLRRATEEVVELPLLKVKCALDCFSGREEEAPQFVQEIKESLSSFDVLRSVFIYTTLSQFLVH